MQTFKIKMRQWASEPTCHCIAWHQSPVSREWYIVIKDVNGFRALTHTRDEDWKTLMQRSHHREVDHSDPDFLQGAEAQFLD